MYHRSRNVHGHGNSRARLNSAGTLYSQNSISLSTITTVISHLIIILNLLSILCIRHELAISKRHSILKPKRKFNNALERAIPNPILETRGSCISNSAFLSRSIVDNIHQDRSSRYQTLGIKLSRLRGYQPRLLRFPSLLLHNRRRVLPVTQNF